MQEHNTKCFVTVYYNEVDWCVIEPDNSGEMINYEAESCDMGIEEGCESVEQPVDYQSASNMIPAASVIMVQNYSPGIILKLSTSTYLQASSCIELFLYETCHFLFPKALLSTFSMNLTYPLGEKLF